MPFANNVYTVPPGTTATTLTAIDSSDYNAFIADIEAAINSLTDGTVSWRAAFEAYVGTEALPGYTFDGDLNTGIWRVAADNIGISAGGTKIVDVATTGVVVTGLLESSKGADIASAATLNLTTATGMFPDITGTTTVTAVTLGTGKRRSARAVGAFQMTASASLIVNGSTTENYTTVAGDTLLFEGFASSIVRVWVIGPPIATAAQMEASASTVVAVPPGRLHRHPSAAKCWTRFNGSGTPTSSAAHSLGSITDNGVGSWGINFSNAFSSAAYLCLTGMNTMDAATQQQIDANCASASQATIRYFNNGGAFDSTQLFCAFFGDI